MLTGCQGTNLCHVGCLSENFTWNGKKWFEIIAKEQYQKVVKMNGKRLDNFETSWDFYCNMLDNNCQDSTAFPAMANSCKDTCDMLVTHLWHALLSSVAIYLERCIMYFRQIICQDKCRK